MTDNFDAKSPENSEYLTLGQQLKQARETLNISIEEVIRVTHLKRTAIESFENNNFILSGIPATFVKGYVRNYVRFLRLPEALIESVDYGNIKSTNEARNLAAINLNQKSQTRWLRHLTIIVLLIAFGMTIIWWWQEYQQEQANRDLFVSNNMAESTQLENKQVTRAAIGSLAESTNLYANAQTVQAETITDINVATPPAEVDINVPLNTLATVEPKPISENAGTANIAVDTPTGEDTNSPAMLINDQLRIEITQATSWLSVKAVNDKKRRTLTEKEYSAGEVLNFNDNQQYQLIIGAPINVKLYYQGQEIPLKIDGRVVKMRLPLTTQ